MNNTMISEKTKMNPILEQINQELPELNKDQIDELISILSIKEKKLPLNQ